MLIAICTGSFYTSIQNFLDLGQGGCIFRGFVIGEGIYYGIY